MRHPAWKSNIGVGPACFEYFVLFELTKCKCIECFKHLFKSPSDRKWVVIEEWDRVKDCNHEFVDDLRSVYIDEVGDGPDVDNMIVFLSSCPKLEWRKRSCMLLQACCLWLRHSPVRVPCVGLEIPNIIDRLVDLSAVIIPLYCYFLSLGQVCSFLTDPSSSAACGKWVDEFGDVALVPVFDFWTSADYHWCLHIY